MDRKSLILNALRAFVRQRPGMEFANYGDIRSYQAEYRGIRRDLQDAEVLLTHARVMCSAEQLTEADAVLGFDDYPDIAARLRAVVAGDPHVPHAPRDRRSMLPLTPAMPFAISPPCDCTIFFRRPPMSYSIQSWLNCGACFRSAS